MKPVRPTIIVLIFVVFAALGLAPPAQGAGPMLSIRREGTNVMVNFATSLQSASWAEGPYTTLLNATSPYVLPISATPRHFWRAATAGGGTFAAGAEHGVALKTDGGLRSWGWNDSGQLGVPGEGDWIIVACGAYYTVALKSDGTLWAWGNNSYGQLGIGRYDDERHDQPAQVTTNADWAAVACGWRHTLALKTDGTLWAWGAHLYGQTYGATNQPMRVGADADWAAVAGGPSHTAAIKTDGSLWTWGENRWGQLGNGTFDNTNQPVRVGADADWRAIACGGFPSVIEFYFVGYTVALKTNGSLWAWGHGQLGTTTFETTNQPVQIGTDTEWTRVTCGGYHTVALKADGTLWARGSNGGGQLGNGTFARTNQMVRVGSDTDWIRVAAGGNCTLALKANGTFWAWGGAVGLIVPTNRPVQVDSDTDWAR